MHLLEASDLRLGLYKLLGSVVAPVAHEGLSRIILVTPLAVYTVRRTYRDESRVLRKTGQKTMCYKCPVV